MALTIVPRFIFNISFFKMPQEPLCNCQENICNEVFFSKDLELATVLINDFVMEFRSLHKSFGSIAKRIDFGFNTSGCEYQRFDGFCSP